MSASLYIRAVLVASAALAVLAWWQRDALPPPEQLSPAVFTEPAQQSTDRPASQTPVGGVTYTVRPLYTYDLAGLVVSKHEGYVLGLDSQGLERQAQCDGPLRQPAIARVLRSARVGDQVNFSGYLAEYSHNQGQRFFRGTSITRTDSGNGACETVFATHAEILRSGNRGWRIAFWLSLCAFAAGIAGWFALPFRAGA